MIASVNAFFKAAHYLDIVTLYGKDWDADFKAICDSVEVESILCEIWADRKSQIKEDGTWDITGDGYPEIPIRIAFQ